MYEEKEFADLRWVIQVCFILMEDLDVKTIASKAMVSPATVRNYAHERFSTCCRYRTVKRLCEAAGIKLEATDGKLQISMKEVRHRKVQTSVRQNKSRRARRSKV
jgi:hypothetical protein